MRWSLRAGKLAGIDVFIHFTFFLLLAWIAFIYYNQNESINAAVTGVAFILAVFACVVLHELGHALTAKKYGIQTRDIILLPIGGVARLEKMPDKPIQELWVALAGPAVNVAIAAVLAGYLYASNSFTPVSQVAGASGSFLERIMAVNIFLVVFNMIPAFPMDGTRSAFSTDRGRPAHGTDRTLMDTGAQSRVKYSDYRVNDPPWRADRGPRCALP